MSKNNEVRQATMHQSEKVIPFECRVCGATDYIEIYSCEVVEKIYHPDVRETADAELCEPQIGYMCCGCSVTFQNSEKFTKSKP